MIKSKNSFTWTKILILALIILACFFLRRALMPLWISIALAYVLNPLVIFWQSSLEALIKKFRPTAELKSRLVPVLLAYLTFLGAVSLLVFSFADIVIEELSRGALQESLRVLKNYYVQYKSIVEEISGFSLSGTGIRELLKNISSSSVTILISLVASVYLLKDKRFFLSLITKAGHLFLPQKIHGIIRELAFDINDVISSFVKGVFIDSILIAVLDSLWLTLLGVDYAVFIGCFAGLTNVSPYVGPVLGFIPTFISAFSGGLGAFSSGTAASGGFTAALVAIAGLLMIQQIESNFIYPKIVGKSVGLHPLFVLLSVTVAGYFGGLIWMILAVPVAGIVKVLIVSWAYKQ